ncbi:hypothetical protein MLD38_019770 [Melastoma candidum]|uniref:Uncharacterized protein n=1 Tax=Melastoma candidum TaxID=119954 RepID=A0ACB9QXZ2_9MYRT|nr:hypothetical protein MLD38_019770 [Melastoma candidum]
MAVDGRPQQALEIVGAGEGEVEKLVADVAVLADRIVRYRRTIPEQLKEAFASLTSLESWDSPSEAGGGGSASRGEKMLGLGTSSLPSWDEEATEVKLELLKRTTILNASAMEPLLKRMRNCISGIGSLNSAEDSIHPALLLTLPPPLLSANTTSTTTVDFGSLISGRLLWKRKGKVGEVSPRKK